MWGNISKLFHKQTDFNFQIGVPPSNPQYWPKEWKEIYHKEYPRMPKIPLSTNMLKLGMLEKILSDRHSVREYDISSKISFEELSTLIHYSAGTRPTSKEWNAVRRYYPSGGARYPLEVYFFIQRVEGIGLGIYHFNVKDNVLEKLPSDNEDIDNLKNGLYYPWSRDAAVVLFITAAWDRNFMKYKDRGYRIILMEAGHLAHNFSLVSSALGISCCNSVGFHNRQINEILGIEHEDEDSLYMAVLGK